MPPTRQIYWKLVASISELWKTVHIPVRRDKRPISMLKDPTAAVFVSETVSLACTPCLRFTQGKGMPACTHR